eukprot:6212067-Pleurochrysis_carterae.AAC.3
MHDFPFPYVFPVASQLPEIHRTNLATALLSIKAMGISQALSLDWVDPPSPRAIAHAATQLYLLEAVVRRTREHARAHTLTPSEARER